MAWILSVHDDYDGRRRWHVTHAFIDLEERLAFIGQAIQIMTELWRIARAYYRRTQPEYIRFWDGPTVSDVTLRDVQVGAKFTVTGLDEELLYYVDREQHPADGS